MSSSSIVPPPNPSQIARMRRKIMNLASIVDKMFALPLAARPLATLKSHIVQLEEAIGDFPDIKHTDDVDDDEDKVKGQQQQQESPSSSPLIEEWRNQIVRFWQRYEQECSSENPGGGVLDCGGDSAVPRPPKVMPPPPSMLQQEEERRRRAYLPVERKTLIDSPPPPPSRPTHRPIQQAERPGAAERPFWNISSSSVQSSRPPRPPPPPPPTEHHPPPLSMEAIRGELMFAFRSIAPVRPGGRDVDALKALILLVTKARVLAHSLPQRPDNRLLEELFEAAFAKLDADLRDQYRRVCERAAHPRRSLCHLRSFLQYAVVECAMKVAGVAKPRPAELANLSLSSPPSEWSSKSSDPSQPTPPPDVPNGSSIDSAAASAAPCKYCKAPGHPVDICPAKDATLCAKCFSFGHSERRCHKDAVVFAPILHRPDSRRILRQMLHSPFATAAVAVPSCGASSASYFVRSVPPYSSDQLYRRLMAALERQPPILRIAQQGRLKSLLLVLSKARVLTIPFESDLPLMAALFKAAFAKLSPPHQEAYKASHRREAHPACLFELRNFVQEQLERFAFRQERTNRIEAATKQPPPPPPPKPKNQQQPDPQMPPPQAIPTTPPALNGSYSWMQNAKCPYCKLAAHGPKPCAVSAVTLCGDCFQFGHAKPYCKWGKRMIRLDDLK